MPLSPKSPLRVLVDLEPLCAGGSNGGIKPALRAMFRWLGAQTEQPFEFIYLSRKEMTDELRQGWLRLGDRHALAEEAPITLAATEACDLVFGCFGMTRWACPPTPTVMFVVDLLHRDFPHGMSAVEVESREHDFRDATERAELFHVISDYTAKRLRHHYAIPSERIVRTYLPIQNRLKSEERKASSRSISSEVPFFFYPANSWAHKNHQALLTAYAYYRSESRAAPWRLVLTGADDAAMRDLQTLAATLCLTEHVDFLGYVEESTLARLWAEAGALVFPSLHEGFGIPLLEAMAYGLPILANNATSIPEIAGDAALLVDARSPLTLAKAMQQIASDAALRTTLSQRGVERLHSFSTDTEFRKLIPAFQSLAAPLSPTDAPPPQPRQ